MTTSRTTRALVGTAAIAGWIACLTTLRNGNVFLTLGLYSLAVIAAVVIVDGKGVRELLRPNRRVILIGIGSGLVMAALTYLGYWLAIALVPSLRPSVQHLFELFWQPPGPAVQLHWLLAIVIAEELLWRGLWPTLLDQTRLRPWMAIAITVALYAIGQSGSGSPMVVALAVGCGVLWAVQRVWTRSLWPPLLTHVIWDVIVLVWLPLE